MCANFHLPLCSQALWPCRSIHPAPTRTAARWQQPSWSLSLLSSCLDLPSTFTSTGELPHWSSTERHCGIQKRVFVITRFSEAVENIPVPEHKCEPFQFREVWKVGGVSDIFVQSVFRSANYFQFIVVWSENISTIPDLWTGKSWKHDLPFFLNKELIFFFFSYIKSPTDSQMLRQKKILVNNACCE